MMHKVNTESNKAFYGCASEWNWGQVHISFAGSGLQLGAFVNV
jgi:hypothetical protein